MPQVLMGLSCGMVWRQALASVSLMGLQGDLKPPGALSGPLGFEMYCPTGMNGPGCQHWKGPWDDSGPDKGPWGDLDQVRGPGDDLVQVRDPGRVTWYR